jgi:predicted nucleic acid-binding protein
MSEDTLVDSNVVIDILDADPVWGSWSQARVAEARRAGQAVINPLIYAEVAGAYPIQGEADRAISSAIYRRENLPWEAAFSAGRVFRAYRRAGGVKRSPLPDFYIGAHAEVRGYALLTRDPGRYRQHFPTLNIIAPDTHP